MNLLLSQEINFLLLNSKTKTKSKSSYTIETERFTLRKEYIRGTLRKKLKVKLDCRNRRNYDCWIDKPLTRDLTSFNCVKIVIFRCLHN